MYTLIRKALFLFPPESVHHFAMDVFGLCCSNKGIKNQFRKAFTISDPALSRNVFGLHFTNPIGLAAGFDKNALYLNELDALGFGFVEIGTVTPKPQPGNDKPRLFRLPADKALINRMGFNNDGVKIVSDRLSKWKINTSNIHHKSTRLIIGGNIGKNKVTPNEDAWKDYDSCFRELFDVVDYFVVNVSSPNTPGLRELQEKSSLRKILSHLQTINLQRLNPKPLLLKIAPDLSREQVDDVIELAVEINLDGLVVSNTTISREGLSRESETLSHKIGAGGLSGLPLKNRSTEMIQYIHQQAIIPIIASGGIFTGDDAREKLDSGASLVQVWTGFIYEGPSIAKNICRSLQS